MTECEIDRAADRSAQPRLLSLDVFRGLIMCTLAINGFALAATAKRVASARNSDGLVPSRLWEFLAFHQSHPPWNSQFDTFGYSYWDMIQPAFMFMVGVAMPYSYASRQRRGQTRRKMTWHALLRAAILVLIGVFLQTRNNGIQTNALLTNVLSQIGLGYFFVYLALRLPAKLQVGLATAVLSAYTLWLLWHPIPASMPEQSIRSVRSLSVFHDATEHFAIGTNGAALADVILLRWLLGDPSIQPHPGGYTTLNFIPSAVTMLIGAMAGTLLRSPRESGAKVKRLVIGGIACMAIATVMSFTWCPVIKRIWTPSWTLFSGAYALWTLAILYWIIDVAGYRRWTFPLVVVGTNSLAMYLLSMLSKRWIGERIEIYFGDELFAGMFGPTYQAVCIFTVLWLICLYLYRNKLFFRI